MKVYLNSRYNAFDLRHDFNALLRLCVLIKIIILKLSLTNTLSTLSSDSLKWRKKKIKGRGRLHLEEKKVSGESRTDSSGSKFLWIVGSSG